MPTNSEIFELLQALRAIPADHFRGDRVSAVLECVQLAPTTLNPFLSFRDSGYTRNLIYRDPAFELVALCWSRGAVSPVHDHGGRQCWVTIQSGVFAEEDFQLTRARARQGRAELRSLGTRNVVTVGELDYRPETGAAHRVTLLSDYGVSLHVYAAPLKWCRVFDLERDRYERLANSYDSIRGIPTERRARQQHSISNQVTELLP